MTDELIKQCADAYLSSLLHVMKQSNNAFIANIIMTMDKDYSEDVTLAEVVGTTLRINPLAFLALSKNDRAYVIVHTAWHVAFLDMDRMGNKDPAIWNEACDHYINLMLIAEEHHTGVIVPRNVHRNPKFRLKEKIEIYELLKAEQDCDCSQSIDETSEKESQVADNTTDKPCSSPIMLEGDFGEGTTYEEGDNSAQARANKIQQAAILTKASGKGIPAAIEEWLENIYNPKLPWTAILSKYLHARNNDDYSYARINKSFFPHGWILPTLYSEGIGKLSVAIDSSSSVTNEEIVAYLGAIKDLKERHNPECLEVLSFTTKIINRWELQQSTNDFDQIRVRAAGGTDICCVFEYYETAQKKPEVLIIFSDMYSEFPEKAPPYDVIFICVNTPERIAKQCMPSWGFKIFINLD